MRYVSALNFCSKHLACFRTSFWYRLVCGPRDPHIQTTLPVKKIGLRHHFRSQYHSSQHVVLNVAAYTPGRGALTRNSGGFRLWRIKDDLMGYWRNWNPLVSGTPRMPRNCICSTLSNRCSRPPLLFTFISRGTSGDDGMTYSSAAKGVILSALWRRSLTKLTETSRDSEGCDMMGRTGDRNESSAMHSVVPQHHSVPVFLNITRLSLINFAVSL